MQYRYTEIEFGIFIPIITLEVLGADWISVDAFVDSGASFSIFHPDAARLLGVNYKKGKLTFPKVGDGRQIPVYEHRLKVRFSDHEFIAVIGFSSRLGVGFNLLGRECFFEKFRICFNDKDKVIETTYLGD